MSRPLAAAIIAIDEAREARRVGWEAAERVRRLAEAKAGELQARHALLLEQLAAAESRLKAVEAGIELERQSREIGVGSLSDAYGDLSGAVSLLRERVEAQLARVSALRDGRDGVPGADGRPGLDGLPGRPGKDAEPASSEAIATAVADYMRGVRRKQNERTWSGGIAEDDGGGTVVVPAGQSSYVMQHRDRKIVCEGACTVTLVSASDRRKDVTIKRTGSGDVVLQPRGSETIDGEATQTLRLNVALELTPVAGHWKIT